MTNNTAPLSTARTIVAAVREANSWNLGSIRGLIFATPAQRLGLSFRMAQSMTSTPEVHPLDCMCLADDPADDRDYA